MASRGDRIGSPTGAHNDAVESGAQQKHLGTVEDRGSDVYQLPLIFADGKAATKADAKRASSHFGIPLHEHTAFLISCGVLHDEIDDRQDAFRGALEIDPLLAAWAVYAANKKNIRLKDMQVAARWLAASVHQMLPDPSSIVPSKPLSVAARNLWRSFTTQAISCARLARQHVAESAGHDVAPAATSDASPATVQGEDLSDAFWFGMLCSLKSQLDRQAKLNGQSPLHGFTFSWPKWMREFEREVTKAKTPVTRAVNKALVSTEKERNACVTQEEQDLWFRPYPEFRSLVPMLFAKLRRLEKIEANYSETLRNEKLAALQQLAYGASHEINNPLANISTRAQSLAYNEHDPERRKKLIAINQQAFRAYEMIADLMLFAKPPRLEIEDVSIADLLDQVRDELTDDALQKDIQLRVFCKRHSSGLTNGHSHVLSCQTDRAQLTSAIKAICQNGIEAMSAGGVLSMSACEDVTTNSVEITIEDSGSGLSESAQRHCFDPFFSGREAGRGLGFGLSKAWRIVEQHRGRIEVSSYPQQGSRFTVILPILFARVRESSENVAASPKETPLTVPPSSHEEFPDASIPR